MILVLGDFIFVRPIVYEKNVIKCLQVSMSGLFQMIRSKTKFVDLNEPILKCSFAKNTYRVEFSVIKIDEKLLSTHFHWWVCVFRRIIADILMTIKNYCKTLISNTLKLKKHNQRPVKNGIFCWTSKENDYCTNPMIS